MEHRNFEELVHLSVFGELKKTERVLLEAHLSECVDCREELESLLKLKSILNKNRSVEVDDKLLNEARMELRSAIRREKSKPDFLGGILFSVKSLLVQNYKPVLSGLTLLIFGLLLGYLFFYQPADPVLLTDNGSPNNGVSSVLNSNDVRISNVRFLDQDVSDGEVEFVFEAIRPMRIKGRIDDENIKNILTYSILNDDNPGTRLNTLSLINSKESPSMDMEIKSAVLDVVMYDENTGVRREAFKLLTKFPYDEEIKQTYLYVLMNDSSSSMRIDAMKALVDAGKGGYKFSPDDLSVFKEKMRTDENNYIRYYAKTVLQENK
ncbi:MAG: zf-HC2 domain-containing protein [Ignavibacteriales bacterium]|nr:MAG: zf-HC2 domain-containing protein [Ignavibacteriales bacterium]